MLHIPTQFGSTWRIDNFDAAPNRDYGVPVTPSSNPATKGSWTEIVAASAVTENIYGFYFDLSPTAHNSTVSRVITIDIGTDPAGGSSYTNIITDLIYSQPTLITLPKNRGYFFPLAIKAGSSIACRIASSSNAVVSAGFVGYGGLAHPENYKIGGFSETIGTITNSVGVSFTPGNGTWGSWVLLGTTVNPLWWWQLGYGIDNGTVTAEMTQIQLAHGDASNKHTIFDCYHIGSATETCSFFIHPQLTMYAGYCPVKAGTNIYIRGWTNNAPDSGYNAAAIGIG